MKRKDLEKWLREYKGREIDYTAHVIRDKFRLGIVIEDDIERNLRNPEKLVRVMPQEPLTGDQRKFKLYFKISSAKTLCIVAVLNEIIKVITAYIILEKLQRRVRPKWRK